MFKTLTMLALVALSGQAVDLQADSYSGAELEATAGVCMCDDYYGRGRVPMNHFNYYDCLHRDECDWE